jgi:hypothetical protein
MPRHLDPPVMAPSLHGPARTLLKKEGTSMHRTLNALQVLGVVIGQLPGAAPASAASFTIRTTMLGIYEMPPNARRLDRFRLPRWYVLVSAA